MNFFDAYEVPGTTTPPVNAQPQQSLNEEVEQVVGQLSRFWGGFRKQVRTTVALVPHPLLPPPAPRGREASAMALSAAHTCPPPCSPI